MYDKKEANSQNSINERIKKIREIEESNVRVVNNTVPNSNLHYPDRGEQWRSFSQWWDSGK